MYGVQRKYRSDAYNVEFDKVFKMNLGDTVQVNAFLQETGAKFSGNSTSFTAYLLDEYRPSCASQSSAIIIK